MVDTGELADRAVAERAGIGWSAKNCSIITPEFGSYVYLGEMITNIPFAPDIPMEDECGDCTLCLRRLSDRGINPRWAIECTALYCIFNAVKKIYTGGISCKIGNRVYGCDTCQTVCPKNKGKHNLHQAAFQAEPELAKPLLQPILRLSNREFKEKFGHVSGSWRGKNPIQRNAILALAHFKEEVGRAGASSNAGARSTSCHQGNHRMGSWTNWYGGRLSGDSRGTRERTRSRSTCGIKQSGR